MTLGCDIWLFCTSMTPKCEIWYSLYMTDKLEGWFCASVKLWCEIWWFCDLMTLKYEIWYWVYMTNKLEGWFCATMKLRCELWWFWASMTLNMKYNIEFRTLKSINRNDDIVSRWPLDTKNDGIVPHEIELTVLWLVWNWIDAIVTHLKLNWWWNWIDGIVAYMKLNWRHCRS
jgi:hypothetical protein